MNLKRHTFHAHALFLPLLYQCILWAMQEGLFSWGASQIWPFLLQDPDKTAKKRMNEIWRMCRSRGRHWWSGWGAEEKSKIKFFASDCLCEIFPLEKGLFFLNFLHPRSLMVVSWNCEEKLEYMWGYNERENWNIRKVFKILLVFSSGCKLQLFATYLRKPSMSCSETFITF